MSEFGRFHGGVNEALHQSLYAVHADIYWRAQKSVQMALMELHKVECSSADLRAQAREYIKLFEALRDELDRVGRSAGDLRSKLMKENGCEGNCNHEIVSAS